MTATRATSGWTVSWTTAGERVEQVWNGSFTAQGGQVVVSNVAWNGAVPANGSTTFGFLGSGNAPSSPALSCSAT